MCKEKGIQVSNAGGYSTNSVAELTFGLIIALLRSIVPLEAVVREEGTKDGYRQTDLKGKTLGVIGTGKIGGTVAELGLAFGCHVIAYNRSEKQHLIDQGVQYKSLDEVLQTSDIVTLHSPLADETKHLIDQEKLVLMKSSAFLINTAIGPIVDNDALAEALHKGTIAGAGLDRVDMEPPMPSDYPILDAPNTVLVPHIGFATICNSRSDGQKSRNYTEQYCAMGKRRTRKYRAIKYSPQQTYHHGRFVVGKSSIYRCYFRPFSVINMDVRYPCEGTGTLLMLLVCQEVSLH